MKKSNKTLVYIPSLSRPESLPKKTLSVLKDYTGSVIVAVEPHEYLAYKIMNKNANILKLEKSGQGLKYANLSAKKYCEKNGFKYLFKIDDDCSKIAHVNGAENSHALALAITDIEKTMDTHDEIGAVSFFAMRFWHFEKRSNLMYNVLGKHSWGVRMIRVSAMPDKVFPVMTHEDSIESLFMWKNGYNTLRYAKIGITVSMNQGKGGQEKFRNTETRKNTVSWIKEKFPDTEIIEENGKVDIKLKENRKRLKKDSKYNA